MPSNIVLLFRRRNEGEIGKDIDVEDEVNHVWYILDNDVMKVNGTLVDGVNCVIGPLAAVLSNGTAAIWTVAKGKEAFDINEYECLAGLEKAAHDGYATYRYRDYLLDMDRGNAVGHDGRKSLRRRILTLGLWM